MKIFAFLDIETTGLAQKEDYVLEVAWQITDGEFNVLTPGVALHVDHAGQKDAMRSRLASNSFVETMHTKTGLVARLETGGHAMADILDAFVADVDWVRGDEDTVHLAGYSVGFDREFLRENGWDTLFDTVEHGWQMHHRLLDLSSIKEMWASAGVPIPRASNELPHSALHDVYESLEFAQTIRGDLVHGFDAARV